MDPAVCLSGSQSALIEIVRRGAQVRAQPDAAALMLGYARIQGFGLTYFDYSKGSCGASPIASPGHALTGR
jgi:hypothetical protein